MTVLMPLRSPTSSWQTPGPIAPISVVEAHCGHHLLQ